MSADFSFSFHDEDIESGSDHEQHSVHGLQEVKHAYAIEPQAHLLQDLLAKLPSQISYNTVSITSSHGSTIPIPRRELFDIRAQLMAEDTSSFEQPLAGLSANDITPNVYEGGFKTWECSVDLAEYLLNQLEKSSDDMAYSINLIELGVGSALPTLTFFHYLLSQRPSPRQLSPTISLTVSDYNISVLALSTIPNLLLTWCAHQNLLVPQTSGDLEITPDLCKGFIEELEIRKIDIRILSGSWGTRFTELLSAFPASNSGPPTTIVLASETVYSPDTLASFTDTLMGSIGAAENAGGSAVGFVAAKKVYFGVGGGVDEFLRVLGTKSGKAKAVWESEGSGVGRVILEVRTTRI